MINSNKRNTSKEKMKENKWHPYRRRINERKWKVVDLNGKEYGKFREKVNAHKEIKRLKKELWLNNLEIEEI